jgi:drug/metabolite transporter (DMT)-like permease
MSAASPRSPRRAESLAIAVLLFSCTLWGLMWWPLKQFRAAGLEGAPLTLLAYGAVGLLGARWLWRERAAWRPQTAHLLGLVVIGGVANTAFVQALIDGDVVRVMLLFYLSPVWSVLGGRLFLGEAVSRRRAGAVGLALAGAFLVVGGTAALSTPLSVSDLLALGAGLAFSGNNLIARAGQAIPMPSKAVAVFMGCALSSGVVLLAGAQTAAWPTTPALWLGVVAFGIVWVGLATATWQYGVTHLEAGRSGVILIAELLVSVTSAVLIGGEVLSTREALGGALIAAAALLEATAPAEPDPAAPPVTA